MKHILPVSFALAALLFLLAYFSAPKTDTSTEDAPLSLLPEESLAQHDSQYQLTVLLQGQLCQMNMEEYLRGVLRAEMPASFELEALKAQAVSARTYTLYRIESGPVANHPEADACDDIGCCKAYLSAGDAAAQWGMQSAFYEQKIRQAVAQTDGEAVLYQQQPILAVFHSSSSGRTQNAEDVWLDQRPYLRSVESPEGEDSVPNYYSTVTFSAKDFKSIFLQAYPQAKLEGNISHWFQALTKNDANLVTSLTIGGITVKGTQLRSLLGLRSASFELETDKDSVTFLVTGYGHGVGMSQYGANQLAKEGKSYKDILTWYYTDTTVEAYTPKQR